MKKICTLIFAAALCFTIAACVTNGSVNEALQTDHSQVALRQMQTRAFDTRDTNKLLRTVIATLQDLGFVIDKADHELGTVSATKLDGYELRMTVSLRPRGQKQTLVRANAQYQARMVEDPHPYQQFFASLQKAMFLTAHKVD